MPRCLVTGANRGIGFEFAKQYAADGWSVIATCRRPQQADALGGLSGDIDVHALDVTDFARVEALAAQLAGVSIDLLINNAGAYGPRTVTYDAIDYRAWCDVLRVNTMAPLKVCSMFVDHVAAGSLKRMVSITSLMGSISDNTSGGSYIYRSSKAALNAAMRSLACDLKGKGIAVVVLHPGWVRTDMGGARAHIDPFESVAGMRQVVAGLRLEDTGRFLNFDGHEIPW